MHGIYVKENSSEQAPTAGTSPADASERDKAIADAISLRARMTKRKAVPGQNGTTAEKVISETGEKTRERKEEKER